MNDSSDHKSKMKSLQKEQRSKVKNCLIERGVIIIVTGDGKGKSSSAFGTAFRAVGHGHRVGIVQFIKGAWHTGEQETFKKFDLIDHFVSGEGFTWDTQNKEKDIAAVRRGWDIALGMINDTASGKKNYQLLVFDELNIALQLGYLPTEEVIKALKNKPEELSIIITGRGAPLELIEVADTVSNIQAVKHAFDGGIMARKGIEY